MAETVVLTGAYFHKKCGSVLKFWNWKDYNVDDNPFLTEMYACDECATLFARCELWGEKEWWMTTKMIDGSGGWEELDSSEIGVKDGNKELPVS